MAVPVVRLFLLCAFVRAGEKEVFDAIFSGYVSGTRPSQNQSVPTEVMLKPYSLRLLDVDGPQNTIKFFVDFTQSWIDYRLMWDASIYNRTSIKIPESILWVPDLIIFSGLARHSLIPLSRRVSVVYDDGTVEKTDPVTISVPCVMKVAKFPFDKQTCDVQIGSWMLTEQELTLGVDMSYIMKTDGAVVNTNEWRIVNVSLRIASDGMERTDRQSLTITLIFQRNPHSYILTSFTTTFIICTLCIFGLFMPTDNTGARIEKVTLGITCLLALTMNLGNATADMPRASTFPVLGVYILCICFLCFFAAITTSIFSFLHERVTTREKTPPRWLSSFLLCKSYDNAIRQRTTSVQATVLPSSNIGQLLGNIIRRIRERMSSMRAESQWTRIFDRLDILAMIIYQVINVLMFVLVLTIF